MQFEFAPGFEKPFDVSMIGKIRTKTVTALTPEEAKALVDNGVNYIRPIPPVAAELVVAETIGDVEKKSESANPN